MTKPRAKQLYGKVEGLCEWSSSERRMLQAIAIMLAEATQKQTTKKKQPDLKLPFSPGDIHKRLNEDCKAWVNFETYDRGSFGRLGKDLDRIVPAVDKSDLEHLVGWISDGGIDHWCPLPTWKDACRHMPNWIARAREWAGQSAVVREPGSGSAVR